MEQNPAYQQQILELAGFSHKALKLLGWCPAGSILIHGEKVPL